MRRRCTCPIRATVCSHWAAVHEPAWDQKEFVPSAVLPKPPICKKHHSICQERTPRWFERKSQQSQQAHSKV